MEQYKQHIDNMYVKVKKSKIQREQEIWDGMRRHGEEGVALMDSAEECIKGALSCFHTIAEFDDVITEDLYISIHNAIVKLESMKKIVEDASLASSFSRDHGVGQMKKLEVNDKNLSSPA